MRILALIPARGGSKRLPRKNILPLGGKPLIVWSIDAAKDIPEICDILVSTDDPEIAEISRQAEALVPWLRPAELSSDTASSVDVALHALEWYENTKGNVDGLMLLQPTSPFRSKHSIKRGINIFIQSEFKNVVGVSPAHSHPTWIFKIKKDGYIKQLFDESNITIKSQGLSKIYTLNGSFYLSSPSALRLQNSFINKKTIPLIVTEQTESIDIDTEVDFKFAEFLVKQNYQLI